MFRSSLPTAAFAALCIAVAAGSPARAAAPTPTPEPGGAQQVAGIEGTLESTLFNGQVRLRKMTLGKPTGAPDESFPTGFVPVKIVLVPAAAGKAFRIDLAPTDLPK